MIKAGNFAKGTLKLRIKTAIDSIGLFINGDVSDTGNILFCSTFEGVPNKVKTFEETC